MKQTKVTPSQTVKVTIQQPPLPDPIATLSIFQKSPGLPTLLQKLLDDIGLEDRSDWLLNNLQDELNLYLATGPTIIGVQKLNGVTAFYFEEKK